jgi:hypothetical protein
VEIKPDTSPKANSEALLAEVRELEAKAKQAREAATTYGQEYKNLSDLEKKESQVRVWDYLPFFESTTPWIMLSPLIFLMFITTYDPLIF